MAEDGQTIKNVCMDADDIERAVTRIAHQILERNHGAQNLALVGIVTRGDLLAKRLADKIFEIEGVRIPLGRLDISFYRDDFATHLSPEVLSTQIDFDIDGLDVVLVDDVLFTGRTIRSALDALMDIGRPQAVQLAVLIDRGVALKRWHLLDATLVDLTKTISGMQDRHDVFCGIVVQIKYIVYHKSQVHAFVNGLSGSVTLFKIANQFFHPKTGLHKRLAPFNSSPGLAVQLLQSARVLLPGAYLCADPITNILQHLRLSLRAVLIRVDDGAGRIPFQTDRRFDLIAHKANVADGLQDLYLCDLPIKLRRF